MELKEKDKKLMLEDGRFVLRPYQLKTNAPVVFGRRKVGVKSLDGEAGQDFMSTSLSKFEEISTESKDS